jgi:hypothetical protein
LAAEPRVATDAVMAELRGRVRDRLRRQLAAQGAGEGLGDPEIFDEVEALLHRSVDTTDAATLLLPELLGDPRSWRLSTAMRYQSHREAGAASAVLFLKRRLLMPVLRWLFEYSRDNFERQRRVNTVLFACVQELAVENARLRRELHQSLDLARGAAGANRGAAPDGP